MRQYLAIGQSDRKTPTNNVIGFSEEFATPGRVRQDLYRQGKDREDAEQKGHPEPWLLDQRQAG